MTFTVSRKAMLGIAFVLVLAVGVGAGVLIAGDGGGSSTTTVVSTAGASGDAESVSSQEGEGEESDSGEFGGDDCAAKGITQPPRNEGTCTEEGTKYVVVNKSSVLELPTLSAKLLGISSAKSATALGETVEANGQFVTLELEVTNRTNAPATFDEYQEQVALYLDGNTYTEDFNVQNGAIQTSFLWQGTAIQPQNSQTGTVTFDVPDKLLSELNKSGNIDIANFGSEEEVEAQKEIGTIRTYQ
jgi:hypothetical protein